MIIKVRDGKGFYLNKYLKQELDIALYAVKYKNQDLVLVFDGQEGSGKSTAARQVAYYCAMMLGSHFDADGVKNIHNDISKYIKSSSEDAKNSVHLLDEARKILNRKRSMGKDAVRFTNYLSECRFLNQVHILCIPAYHDLDRYVAQWRISFVVHMYKEWRVDERVEMGGHELRMGAFKLFINDSYLKHFYDQYGFQYPTKWATKDRFNGFEILSPEGEIAYDKQKYGAMKNKYVDEVNAASEKKNPTPKDMAIKYHKVSMLHGKKIPAIVHSDVLGVSERTVREYFRQDSLPTIKNPSASDE